LINIYDSSIPITYLAFDYSACQSIPVGKSSGILLINYGSFGVFVDFLFILQQYTPQKKIGKNSPLEDMDF